MHIYFDRVPNLSLISFYGPDSQNIAGIAYNSECMQPQWAFCAIKGAHADGHTYIEQALQAGAAAVIGTNEAVLFSFFKQFPHVTFICVKDARESMAYLADYLADHAQEHLIKIGVTGTNGKTTVTSYVRDLFNLLGVSCGMLGTTGIWDSQGKMNFYKSTPTTPMSSDIHLIYRLLHQTNHEAAAMEVSSIALDQKRVTGILFDIAIYTNFSEEHMEYHHTMEHYKQSKLLLFKQALNSIVNLDDREGIAEEVLKTARGNVLTYSCDPHSNADLIWTNCRHSSQGVAFQILYKGKIYDAKAPVYGEYNVSNLLAAIGAALLLDIEMEQILNVLPGMKQVEGRFQVIDGPENRKVIIDYAHTPAAIKQVLKEVRRLPHTRLIAMIAGIGIRDFNKMPKIARAAQGKADFLVVTVDHPGFHDPGKIIQKVLSGFHDLKEPVAAAETRREGVKKALQESRPGDIVLLTSGCINGCQIVKGEHIPHSDEEIIDEFFQTFPPKQAKAVQNKQESLLPFVQLD